MKASPTRSGFADLVYRIALAGTGRGKSEARAGSARGPTSVGG